MRRAGWWMGMILMTISGVEAAGGPQVIAMPGKDPLITLRVTFRTGAVDDPKGKEGLAALTASMISEGGTRDLTYKQLVDAMYPMSTSVSSQVDKEMTTFIARTHADNLDAFYKLFRAMLLEPGWRADDLSRLRDDAVNYLRIALRGNNDEELGKEVLYETIYAGHPYGHQNIGHVAALQSITLDDLRAFYKRHYTRANLTIALGGGYPDEFRKRLEKDLAALAAGESRALKLPAPKAVGANQLVMVEKQTRSVAFSFGFPISVKRGDPDFPALLVAQSYLGQHRQGGRLYERMRELRGLNYGDYSYIEHFPGGMFTLQPPQNVARQQQIFQVWIRPVEPATAHFALRLAVFELGRLVREGLTQEEFERTRSFLSKYVNLLTSTKSSELGYAIDSAFYGTPAYTGYVRQSLAKLTREDVNRAIQKHLRAENLVIVAIGQNTAALRDQVLANTPSPMKYNSPKPADILAEDKVVEKFAIPLKPENVKIVPAAQVFE